MAAIPPPSMYSSDQPISSSSGGNQDNDSEEGTVQPHASCATASHTHFAVSLTAAIPAISSSLLKKAPKKITLFSNSGKLV